MDDEQTIETQDQPSEAGEAAPARRVRWMGLLAKWHIWLAWLTGIPILMWTVTGLVMVSRPIEEVRGTDRLIDLPEQALPRDITIAVQLPPSIEKPVRSVGTRMERGELVTRITYTDGSSERLREDGTSMAPLSELEARLIVAERVSGGDQVASTRRFTAEGAPFDFRRPIPTWQVVLEDGTHVYVGTESGEIEAVRTEWWRTFDFMWGLHIMDLQTREDTSHPILILFAGLGVLGSLLGCTLMFRRRKARVQSGA